MSKIKGLLLTTILVLDFVLVYDRGKYKGEMTDK